MCPSGMWETCPKCGCENVLAGKGCPRCRAAAATLRALRIQGGSVAVVFSACAAYLIWADYTSWAVAAALVSLIGLSVFLGSKMNDPGEFAKAEIHREQAARDAASADQKTEEQKREDHQRSRQPPRPIGPDLSRHRRCPHCGEFAEPEWSEFWDRMICPKCREPVG